MAILIFNPFTKKLRSDINFSRKNYNLKPVAETQLTDSGR